MGAVGCCMLLLVMLLHNAVVAVLRLQIVQLASDLNVTLSPVLLQDVLQCQLEDLDRELHSLRKSLIACEDRLHEKVTELSAAEAEALAQERRAEEAERHCRRAEAVLQEVDREKRR